MELFISISENWPILSTNFKRIDIPQNSENHVTTQNSGENNPEQYLPPIIEQLQNHLFSIRIYS